VPFRRFGRPEEYAQLAHTMITNGYFNGEDVYRRRHPHGAGLTTRKSETGS
jgi:hypothetical protein